MGDSSDSSLPAGSRVRFPVAALAFLWGLLVLAKYFFWTDDPVFHAIPSIARAFDAGSFPPVPASRVLDSLETSLFILAVAFLASGTAWSLGRRVRRWLGLAPGDPWAGFALDFGLGAAVLDLFWTGTGLVRLWYPPLGWAAACLGPALFLVDGAVLFSPTRRKGLSVFFARPREAAFLALFLAGCFYWGFSLLQDLAPETFYDSMVYHLAVPRYWLFHHGLRDFPTNFFSNYPYGGELFFLNGLAFQGTETAKMLNAVCYGTCAFLAGGWARELGGERSGWLALGLILTLPLLSMAAWTADVEGFLALALVLFAYCLLRFLGREGRRGSWALAAGLFGGLAFSTKYTAAIAIAAALLAAVFVKREVLGRRAKHLPAALGAALLFTAPWFLKSLAYTGNPFYPYFPSWFPGRHLSLSGYRELLREQHGWAAHTALSWLALPWTLSLSSPDSYNFCGPLVLAALPLLFLFRFRHPVLRWMAVFLPVYFAASLAVTHILKFMLPGFLLFYILLSVVLGGGNRPGWGRTLAWTAAFSALFCFAYLAEISNDYYACAGVWTGRQTRAQYLEGPGKITPYYAMARWINDRLPRDARVLVVGDARGLYYGRPFLTNTVFDGQVLSRLARESADAGGIARGLRELGVDYLAVNGAEGIRVSAQYHHYELTPAQWARLDDFIQDGTDLVYEAGFQGVYRVLPSLRGRSGPEKPDLVLFFSKPASRFVLDLQRRMGRRVLGDLRAAARLYPFSAFWREEEARFERAAGVSAQD